MADRKRGELGMADEITRHGRNPGAPGQGLDRSSQIVVHAGTAHFVSTPDKPYDPTLSAGDMMRQALARVDERLALIGSTRADLLMVQVWIRDMRFFQDVNTTWDGWIDQNAMPVRACCACDMGNPDLKVELVVTARAHRAPPAS